MRLKKLPCRWNSQRALNVNKRSRCIAKKPKVGSNLLRISKSSWHKHIFATKFVIFWWKSVLKMKKSKYESSTSWWYPHKSCPSSSHSKLLSETSKAWRSSPFQRRVADSARWARVLIGAFESTEIGVLARRSDIVGCLYCSFASFLHFKMIAPIIPYTMKDVNQ